MAEHIHFSLYFKFVYISFDSIFVSSPIRSVPPVALWIFQTAQSVLRGEQVSESYSSTWNLFKFILRAEISLTAILYVTDSNCICTYTARIIHCAWVLLILILLKCWLFFIFKALYKHLFIHLECSPVKSVNIVISFSHHRKMRVKKYVALFKATIDFIKLSDLGKFSGF